MKPLRQLLRRLLDRWLFEQSRSPWRGSDPAVKAAQLELFHRYRQMLAQGVPVSAADTGLRVFSGTDDDGVLLFVFAAIGFRSRACLDIGAADGINSNCANLLLNFGFHGLLFEGDAANVRRGQRFYARHPDTCLHPPEFRQALVTAENINALVADGGLAGEIDLLSVDIDGNDFWVWKALAQVAPRVVIIETHLEFNDRDIVVPYDPNHRYPGRHPQYFGASLPAMVELGRQKGYRLVATNRYGFNAIFVRTDEAGASLPELSVAAVLAHPRNRARLGLCDEIKDWKYTSAR
jgi:hypothetical protein